MTTLGVAKKVESHAWMRETLEHYVEPRWCSERLFQEEPFEVGARVWDPCCGFGRITDSAAAQGFDTLASDIVDRGYVGIVEVSDFLTYADHTAAPYIVCNPPFNLVEQFAQHALSLRGTRKVAMIFPTARLNAARWLRETPLSKVWLMTPRPSMPPGHVIARGDKPGGGKMDFCWLVWAKGRNGPPMMDWLRRDRPQPA